ncbi:MAG: hypothetical protein GKR89_25685 [Candidatus Latescibacteria bacterium]|nr:hypothetical protein [Candidatus Latescibacterota bacterium]
MDDIKLLETTSNPLIDRVLEGMVQVFEMVFPDRIRGYYLLGSFVDGSAMPTSDIDGFILFKGNFTDSEEEQRAWALRRSCSRMMTPELDFSPIGEAVFSHHGDVSLKLASLLLYGEDIRPQLGLPDMDFYTRMLMHNTLGFLRRIRKPDSPFRYPLDYPDPDDEYFGYVVKGVDQANRAATKELINCVGKPALALVALQTGRHVKNKMDCLEQYRTHINDEWTGLLEDIYDKCRALWHYGIPADPEGQAELKALCQRTLLYENYYLHQYREFLVREIERPGGKGQWLSFNEAANWLGLPRELVEAELAAGRLQSRQTDGEVRCLIESFNLLMAVRGLAGVVYGDLDVGALVEPYGKSENVFLRHLVGKALE